MSWFKSKPKKEPKEEPAYEPIESRVLSPAEICRAEGHQWIKLKDLVPNIAKKFKQYKYICGRCHENK